MTELCTNEKADRPVAHVRLHGAGECTGRDPADVALPDGLMAGLPAVQHNPALTWLTA